tara:strand:- start:1499 stop:1828 length:330 start_codon:yes stop_codon:yes gene_type:complete
MVTPAGVRKENGEEYEEFIYAEDTGGEWHRSTGRVVVTRYTETQVDEIDEYCTDMNMGEIEENRFMLEEMSDAIRYGDRYDAELPIEYYDCSSFLCGHTMCEEQTRKAV